MNDLENAIYNISPIESPLIFMLSRKYRTILDYSGNDERVRVWLWKQSRKKANEAAKFEWMTDELS